MTNHANDTLAVEQRHRDAGAAQYLRIQAGLRKPHAKDLQKRTVAEIRAGRWDKDDAVQAFARFERDHMPVANSTGLREDIDRLEAAVNWHCGDECHPDARGHDSHCGYPAWQNIKGHLANQSDSTEAKFGWTYYGPDGEWHWSSKPDYHESVQDLRLATPAEAAFAARYKSDSTGEKA